MQINPAQSALQNLLNLIGAANTGTNPPSNPNQVTFSNLQSATSGTDASVNTSVELTGVSAEGYSGSVTIEYGRLSVAAEAAEPTGNVGVTSIMTEAQMLAAVESFYGFIPGEVSFVSAPSAPGTVPGTNTATIQANGSLVYLDGTATVNLSWTLPNTIALLHFEGANGTTTTTDDAGNTVTLHGSAALTTATKKIGSSALLTGATKGSSAELTGSSSEGLTGDFTLETWIQRTGTTEMEVFDKSGSTTITARAYIDIAPTTGQLSVKMDGTSAATNVGTTANIPAAGSFFHLAIVKSGSTVTAYVNGTPIGNFTSTATFGVNSGDWCIGNNLVNGGDINSAYIDEVRISRIARYTAAFTPQTTPFTLD